MREQVGEELKRLREENARLKRELAEVKRFLARSVEHAPNGIPVNGLGPELTAHRRDDIKGLSYEQHARTWAVFPDSIDPAGYELPLPRVGLSEIVKRAELFEHASDSIMVRDLNDKLLFWNSGAAACYGWTREKAVGQIAHILLQTRFPKPLEAITEELFQQNRWEGELVHVTRNGNEIVVASRWALLRDAEGKGRATLEISTDITGRKLMEKQLEEKSNRLQEVNTALKVLLKHRDEDKRDFQEALLTNVENLVLPYLKRMKTGPLSSTQTALVEILESNIKEITSEFGKTLALQFRVLTPTEMRVAALVREGKTSKEIADILCTSEKTASFHRNNIRRKLGLQKAGINLRSHLLTLT